MKELSVFVDESGDFGPYDYHSPYYIITMLFHDQSQDISDQIARLDQSLQNLGVSNLCVHTGPIIRREYEYRYLDRAKRRRIFNRLVAFIRHIDIRYWCVHIEKRHIESSMEATAKLSRQIAQFINDHSEELLTSDVKIYYDNGQVEVTRLLTSVFYALLPRVDIREVVPSDYRLFQVADMICSLELIRLKLGASGISNSEREFFGNLRDLKKNYLKPLERLKWT